MTKYCHSRVILQACGYQLQRDKHAMSENQPYKSTILAHYYYLKYNVNTSSENRISERIQNLVLY